MPDWGALPPEINSARMYAGAGAGPLMAAATTFSNLSSELSSTASSYQSVVSQLTGSDWLGSSSAAMSAAVEPFISWLSTTSTELQEAASQATASAAAYEAAFAATVPPAEVAANRAQLATLVATNVLGVNTAAIAATETQYGEMWAQDSTAMYTYAAASLASTQLAGLTSPTETTNASGVSAQGSAVSAAVASNSTTSTLNSTLSNLSSSLSSATTSASSSSTSSSTTILSALNDLLGTGFVENGVNGAVNTAAWFVMNAIPTAVSLGHTLGAVPAVPFALTDSVAPVAGAAAVTPGTMVGSVSGAAASATLGEASAVGGLSVPGSWSAAAPATTLASAAAPLEGSGWTVGAEEPVAAMPGMPGMAAAGKGAGAYGAAPRYGFKPVVMPKQLIV
ncbi:PPE family protein [Mycobacterium sp. 4858]|uniref:PPE family protein n=1 Tax=Mycobacterium sp. 4858 TaxID=2057185 RepID=UPI000C858CDD|nr:PPE family protein [Mycobacterium sp. 4858]